MRPLGLEARALLRAPMVWGQTVDSVTRLCLTALLAVAACDSPAPAASPRETDAAAPDTVPPGVAGSVAGCWNVVIELPFPVGETPGELCLVQDAERWSGKFFLKGEWRVLQSLVVTDAGLRFGVDTPMGTAHFDLAYDGTALSGTADGKLGKRAFHASRKPAS